MNLKEGNLGVVIILVVAVIIGWMTYENIAHREEIVTFADCDRCGSVLDPSKSKYYYNSDKCNQNCGCVEYEECLFVSDIYGCVKKGVLNENGTLYSDNGKVEFTNRQPECVIWGIKKR